MSDDSTGKLVDALIMLFGNEDTAHSGSAQGLENDVERLRHALLNMKNSIADGQMKLFSLAMIKERLGADWEKKLDHVHAVCDAVLKRHLGHRHFYYRAGDTIYVIVFDIHDTAAANAAARAISQEIVMHFLGREAVERRLGIETDLASIIPANLMMTLENDTNDVNQASLTNPASSTMKQRAPATGPDFDTPASSAAPGHQARPHSSESAVPSRQFRRADRLDGPYAGTVRSVKDLLDIDYSYSPIWSAPKKAVFSHHLNVVARDAENRILDMGGIAGDPDGINLLRRIDQLALRQAIADLASAIDQGKKYIACIPVTSYSLLQKWGTQTVFDSVLTGLRQPLPQLIVLDVVDAQALDRRDVDQCSKAAEGKCKYLLMRLSLDQTSFPSLARPMVRAVGGSLLDHGWLEKDAARKLNSFVAGASDANLETFLFGITSRSMAFAAIGAGFDYISGTAIAEDAAAPTGIRPVDLLGLFG